MFCKVYTKIRKLKLMFRVLSAIVIEIREKEARKQKDGFYLYVTI